ncbi:acyltransferase family protein [Roseivirga misakiensis]|uniref:Acyltransferase 3 domain-containing protein n=1 Tax=Roseivirga misakiensis TaxID=1563681 RepID=A0A1E5SZ33_9BACT|nr:acyltransferase family protein [Roseivirga misakiensis]OEK04372.1 hypothetical protein BFP71_12885 [Roseivirga misakiensis]
MIHTTLKAQRLHAMDALRAIMMLLGVILHTTEIYSLGDDPYWPKDPTSSHRSMNFIFGIIHIFRMPIFFMIAGFFGALLYFEKGPQAMLKNRVSRILFPFIVFLLLIHPIIISVWRYTSTIFDVKVASVMSTYSFLPSITYHLWFLYYLVIITLFALFIAIFLKKLPKFANRLALTIDWLMNRRLVFTTVFSVLTFLMLVWMWDTWITTSLSFIPNVPVLVAYSMFYALGWALFKSMNVLYSYMKYDWLFTILAVVIFSLRFFFRPYVSDVLYGAINAIIIWFFVFGIIGLFIRYASRYSYKMRYISDASYWVYLVHLPLVTLFAGLIAQLAVPAFIKFLIVIMLTSGVCFASYHYLVRRTFIGKFLNGKKYK